MYEPLYAATDGVIQYTGFDGYYTPYHVDLVPSVGDYADEIHIYGHMQSLAPGIQTGAVVKKGDLLGTSGTDLLADGTPNYGNHHLHWERRKRDNTTPSKWRSADLNVVLTSSNANGGTTPPPPTPSFVKADKIKVVDGPLRIRSSASLAGTVIGQVETGDQLCVTGGPTTSGGYDWFQIDDGVTSGWTAGQFCAMVTIGGCKSFAVNDRVRVASGPVKVRASAGLTSRVLSSAIQGAKMCITGSPVAVDRYRWYPVDAGTINGWVTATNLDLDLAGGCATTLPTSIPTTGIVSGDVLSVSASAVNLRVSPALGTSVVASLPNGTKAVVIGGPVAADSYNWYQVDSRLGRGWVPIFSMAEITSFTNRVANPTATTDLSDISVINAESTVSRVQGGSAWVVKRINSGVGTKEGMRYASSTLALTGQRWFSGVVDIYGSGRIDEMKVRVMYSDGSTSLYSAAAPNTVLSTAAWRRLVTPVIASNPSKTVSKVELWIRRNSATGQTFYVDNGKIIDL